MRNKMERNVKIKILKDVVRNNATIMNTVLAYVATGGAVTVPTNDDMAIYETFELDRQMFFLYAPMTPEQCQITGVVGVLEIPIASLETEYIDGRKLKDIVSYCKIKNDKALVSFFVEDPDYTSMRNDLTDDQLRWFLQFAETDFVNFYTTKKEANAKKEEYETIVEL